MISVIIPVFNGEKIISRCLKSLLYQNYPKNKYEILVVDDGSTDKTKNVVRRFKKVRLIEQKHAGPAVARNLGVKYSEGDIILFTDADCVPDKNWIKNMVEPFKDKNIVGVSGTYKTLNKNKPMARFVGYEIDERHEMLKKEKTIDFIGTFSAGYRKDVFVKFGGFDRKFLMPSSEDPELSFKISQSKMKMIFQPKAFVYHEHPDNLWKYLKQKFWRGYWRVLLYKKHPKKIVRHSYTPTTLYLEIIVTWLTLLFLLLGLLGLIHRVFGITLLFISFLTAVPMTVRIFRKKKDRIVGVLTPSILFLRNISLGLGILFGIKLLFGEKKA